MPGIPQHSFKLLNTLGFTSLVRLAQAAPPKDFGLCRVVTPDAPVIIQGEPE